MIESAGLLVIYGCRVHELSYSVSSRVSTKMSVLWYAVMLFNQAISAWPFTCG